VAYPDGVADLIQERRPVVLASHLRLQPLPNTVYIHSIVCDPNKQATARMSLQCPTGCESCPSDRPVSFGLRKALNLRCSPLERKCALRTAAFPSRHRRRLSVSEQSPSGTGLAAQRRSRAPRRWHAACFRSSGSGDRRRRQIRPLGLKRRV
jgi:hypothetical protein